MWEKIFNRLSSVQVYYLMHENIELAIFKVYNDRIEEISILSGKSMYHLPISVFYSKNKELDLACWITSRSVPSNRKNIKLDLGVDRFSYLIKNFGLSLSDHYWFKPIGETNLTWEDMNLYTNDFKEIYDFRLDNDLCDYTSFTPNASLGGFLQKKWVIDGNGNRVLIKGNTSSINFLDSIAEVFASEMHKRQNKFRYVDYEFTKIMYQDEEITASLCENFTSIDTELVHGNVLYLIPYDLSNNNLFERSVNILNKYFGLNMRQFLEYQIMTDFLLTNTDRHFNNFGFLRNSHTLNSLGYAPIYDSGHSFGIGIHGGIPKGNNILRIHTNSFCNTEVELLKQVKNKDLVDINLLPNSNELYNLLSLDSNISESKRMEIVNLYNLKIKYLIDFQNGCQLWNMN